MSETATVLYDFEGLPENGEISLSAGETVTVTNKSVGDGWWEGTSSNGSTGLFPEAYVQLNNNAQDFYQVCSFLPLSIEGYCHDILYVFFIFIN